MSNSKKDQSFISARAFISAILVIAVLMVITYIATLLIPCEGLPFWKWLLSPFLVLGGEDMVTLIGLMIFLLIVGAVFNSLDQSGMMKYMLDVLTDRFKTSRYKLMAVLIAFFMGMGSLIGCFEEVVPLVPIVTALAVRLGWDALTGLSMSLLSVGCGFAAGVFNPFTVGAAQTIAGLPMFSGAWFRFISFVCIYALLFTFVRAHAKKIDKGDEGIISDDFVRDPKKEKGLIAFAVILGIGILIVFASAVITALQDYTFVIVALTFLIAGTTASLISGMKKEKLMKSSVTGLINMLPAIIMILMASSIKYTLQTAGALDTILNAAISLAQGLPAWAIILFIYLLVLIMNFFIASGSAKVILLMPILLPIAKAFGISPQLTILAFAFGDGFSNVFYPTNAALLISLGLSNIKYGKWFKHCGLFQLLNLILTSLLLLLGLAIGV